MSVPQIITFGCRLNAHESQIMAEQARALAGARETVIVNTCAVTAEAERQARQAIRRARREKPSARIVVTGCSAQINPAAYAAMPEVDQVLGNEEKLRPEAFGIAFDERVRVNDIMQVRETATHLVGGYDGRARAFVQVQNGCDHRCTFCIIPYGRGNSRSVPLGPIVDQVRSLVEAGFREIVLTGVDITSYGADLPGAPSLGAMMQRLLAAVPELPRLRLTSLDSIEVDDALFELIAHERRLMPHFHLSLQAGDDMILRRMKRRHLRADAIDFCARVRAVRPDAAFGADLIAGFPTESDAMFENSLRIVDECGLTFLHVFPYSERPGTPAAKMPAVPKQIRKARAAALRAKGEQRLAAFLGAQQGLSVSALVEQGNLARTEQFAAIRLDRGMPAGSIVCARVTGSTATELRGAVL
ncbi:MAG: tRNA (N(6)-L-threonylcarbamoyladenosine(37)-C(2))-methylthiotransferase MtaB [Alphaproteobacteria bacterium]